MIHSPGMLYLVATPIGNKEDISLRALRILREVNVIAAEDTRHSKLLLQHYQITTPLLSLHNFNEIQRIPHVLERLSQGQSVALISDAGTPLINDPGYALVKAAYAAGVAVTPIPGACAIITALCAAGLATDRFVFEGFLPTKTAERKRRIALLQKEPRTIIFYEVPHRITACVMDIIVILTADRKIVLAKELTKTFETFFRGTAQAALAWLAADANHSKGEFVVLIQGSEMAEPAVITEQAEHVLSLLAAELPQSQAIELTARITGAKKNALKAMCFKNNKP